MLNAGYCWELEQLPSEEFSEVVLIILFCTVSHVCIFHSFCFGETVESWDCGNVSCMMLLISHAASTFTAGLSCDMESGFCL